VEVRTTERARDPWEEEERSLIAAGWKPKELEGSSLGNFETGSYYSAEVSLHHLER